MKKKTTRTPEGARAIIEYNIKVLYHLPSQYKYIHIMLKDTKKELLKILNYIKDIEPIIWKQKYVWYLDNVRLTTRVRKKTTYPTSNRHFNYLCCIGLLKKQKQIKDNMIGINKEFLLETSTDRPENRPINVFSVYKYTTKELERLEEQAKLLHEKKITPGNISKDKLVASGLPELAKRIYYLNKLESYTKKETSLNELIKALNKQINNKGYATIQSLSNSLNMSQNQIRELIKIFKLQMAAEYNYKAATKEQKELLNITTNKWIFTKKE